MLFLAVKQDFQKARTRAVLGICGLPLGSYVIDRTCGLMTQF